MKDKLMNLQHDLESSQEELRCYLWRQLFCLFLLTPINTSTILFHVRQSWLSVQATENNSGFGLFDWEEISSFTPYVWEGISKSFPWGKFINRSLTSQMSEYFFMPSIYLESIDQIQARELNYLIFLFDNDL